MNFFIDLNQDANASLIVDRLNTQSRSMPPVFYGDKWEGKFYFIDNGVEPEWIKTSSIFIAIGDVGNDPIFLHQLKYQDGVAVADFDIQTDAFELLTRGLESVQKTFEIQISKSDGTIQTVLQQPIEVRNQILVQLDVDLVAPERPTIIGAEILQFPIEVYDLQVDSSPRRPEQVNVSATGTNTEGQRPFNPFDVRAEVAQEPLAPEEVDAIIYPIPDAPDWCFAGLLAEAPDLVDAIIGNPSNVDEVEAVNLSDSLPTPALALEIETIPLEVDQLVTISIPNPPLEVEFEISPNVVTELVAYDYNFRPAGWFGGNPSQLEAEELFAPAEPDNVRAAEGANPQPSEVEAYVHVTSGTMSSPVKVQPSLVKSARSPIEPTIDDKYELVGTSDYKIGTNTTHTTQIGFSTPSGVATDAGWNNWENILSPYSEKILRIIKENGFRFICDSNSWSTLNPLAYPDADKTVAEFLYRCVFCSTQSFKVRDWQGKRLESIYKYAWEFDPDGYPPIPSRLGVHGFNLYGWYRDSSPMYTVPQRKYVQGQGYVTVGEIDLSTSYNQNTNFNNAEGFTLFTAQSSTGLGSTGKKWFDFQGQAREFSDSLGVMKSQPLGPWDNKINMVMQFYHWAGIPMLPTQNSVTIEDITEESSKIYKVRLTPKFSRFATYMPTALVGQGNYGSYIGSAWTYAGNKWWTFWNHSQFMTSGNWEVQFADTDENILQSFTYDNFDQDGLPEELEWTDPNGETATFAKVRVIQHPAHYITVTDADTHPDLGKPYISDWLDIEREQTIPEAPSEMEAIKIWTPDMLEESPIWWFDASDENCFDFADRLQTGYSLFYQDKMDPIYDIKNYLDKRGSAYPSVGDVSLQSEHLYENKVNEDVRLNSYRYYDAKLRKWGVQDMGGDLYSNFDSTNFDIFIVATPRYAEDIDVRGIRNGIHDGGKMLFVAEGGGQHYNYGRGGFPNTTDLNALENLQINYGPPYKNHIETGADYFVTNVHGSVDPRRRNHSDGHLSKQFGLPHRRSHFDNLYLGYFEEYTYMGDVPPIFQKWNHGKTTRYDLKTQQKLSGPFGTDEQGYGNTNLHHYISQTTNHYEITRVLKYINEWDHARSDQYERGFRIIMSGALLSLTIHSFGSNSDFYVGNTLIDAKKFNEIPIRSDWMTDFSTDQTDWGLRNLYGYLTENATYNSDAMDYNMYARYNSASYNINKIRIGWNKPTQSTPPNGENPQTYYQKHFHKKNLFTHEILITRRLTYEERKNVQGYLAHKWGINNKLFGDWRDGEYKEHQFRNEPPTEENYLQQEYPLYSYSGMRLGNNIKQGGNTQVADIYNFGAGLETSHPWAVIGTPRVIFGSDFTGIEGFCYHDVVVPREYVTWKWTEYQGYRIRSNGTTILTGQAWYARFAWNIFRDMYFQNCPDIPYASLESFNSSNKMPIWLYQEENPNPVSFPYYEEGEESSYLVRFRDQPRMKNKRS